MISCSPQLEKSVNKQINVPSRYELFDSYNFEWLSPFKNNMAIAMLGGQSIVINQYGHKVLDYPYDDERLYFFGEYLIVNHGSGKMGNVIDMKGEEVFQQGYSNLRCECDCGYFTAIKSGKAGILTFEDRKFHPFDNSPIFLRVTSQGHLLIKNEKLNTTDLVSIEGKVLERIPYKIVRELDNGNFLVKNEGYAMLLDSQSKKNVSLNYDDLKVTGIKGHIIAIRDKKYGIINSNGLELLPPKHDHIRDINGYYVFRDSTILGLMNKEMNILHRYESTCGDIFFHRPYFCCTTDSSSLVYNVDNQLIKRFHYKITYNVAPLDHFIYKMGGRTGFLNQDLSIKTTSGTNKPALGLEVIDIKENKAVILPDGSMLNNSVYSSVKSLEMNNKLVLGNDKTKKVGLFSRSGEAILPMEYDRIEHLYRNYLIVTKGWEKGIAKQNGEIILGPQFKDISYHSGIYIVTKSNNESFVLDGSFNPFGLSDCNHVETVFFPKNLVILGNKDKQVLYDVNTKSIIEEGEKIEQISFPNYFQISKNGQFGIMDVRSLDMIVPFQSLEYRQINSGKAYAKDYFIGSDKANSKVGIVNLAGEDIIPVVYDRVKWFNSKEKLICLEKDSKVGVKNLDNEVVVPFFYDDIQKFVDRQSVVRIDNKFGVINDKGQLLSSFDYSVIKGLSEGKRRMEKGGKWGFLDEKGQVFIEAKYESVRPFRSRLAIFRDKSLYGIINDKKEIIVPNIYEKISFIYEKGKVEKCLVTLEGQKFVIDLNGRCVEECPEEELLDKYNLEKNK
jgi:hypothetical protein